MIREQARVRNTLAEQVLTNFIWQDSHLVNVAIELRDPVTADAVASTNAGDGD